MTSSYSLTGIDSSFQTHDQEYRRLKPRVIGRKVSEARQIFEEAGWRVTVLQSGQPDLRPEIFTLRHVTLVVEGDNVVYTKDG